MVLTLSGGAERMSGARVFLVINGVGDADYPADITVHHLPFAALNARTISEVLPDLVIMPLFGPGFDAIDALAQLEQFGFRGEVLVHTPRLPDGRLVQRELSAAAPALRITLRGPMS